MRLIAKQWNLAHWRLLLSLKAACRSSIISGPDAPPIRPIIEQLAELTRANRRYLAMSLNEKERHAACLHHYGWLASRLSAAALHSLSESYTEIWRSEVEGLAYVATVQAERFVAREGELSIELFLYAEPKKSIGVLSFAIVPGRLFGMEAPDVILVSRVQGRPDIFNELRLVTKAMCDVAPRAVLFAILCGMARAFGLRHVVGVAGENYINWLPDNREALERQYDCFFASLDAQGPVNGFYSIDLDAPPKPVDAVKAGHRIRTRRKRETKARIANSVLEAWPARFPPRTAERAGDPIPVLAD